MFEQKRRGLTGTLLLTTLLLSFAVSIISASAVALDYYGWDVVNPPEGDDYYIELIDAGVWVTDQVVAYPSPDVVEGYKWTYDVTVLQDGSEIKDISHWILAFCGGEESILGASHSISYGADPSGTYLWGIKFNQQVTKGTKITFWFILDGDYPQSEVPVALKPGNDFLHGTITGPLVVTDAFTVEITVEGPQGVDPLPIGYHDYRMKATATVATVSPIIVYVEFNWYGPFGESETPSAIPAKLELTTVDILAPFESWYRAIDLINNPNGLLHDDDLGSWFVEAKFYTLVITGQGGLYLKGIASDTLDISDVPWFTSLPLAVLATVGVVFLLRRKGHISLPV
jgi:hypothetical protein